MTVLFLTAIRNGHPGKQLSTDTKLTYVKNGKEQLGKVNDSVIKILRLEIQILHF